MDRSLVGYSPWGHKRVRHDRATEQQLLGDVSGCLAVTFKTYLTTITDAQEAARNYRELPSVSTQPSPAALAYVTVEWEQRPATDTAETGVARSSHFITLKVWVTSSAIPTRDGSAPPAASYLNTRLPIPTLLTPGDHKSLSPFLSFRECYVNGISLWLKHFFSDVDHFLQSLLNLFLNIGLFLFYVLVVWPRGTWDLSSLTWDRTRTPSIGRQSINHWTPRKSPVRGFFRSLLFIYFHSA